MVETSCQICMYFWNEYTYFSYKSTKLGHNYSFYEVSDGCLSLNLLCVTTGFKNNSYHAISLTKACGADVIVT